MAQDRDYLLSGNADVPILDNNSVLPLVDGDDFLPELETALGLATGPGDFIYLHGWCVALVGGDYVAGQLSPEDPTHLSTGRVRNLDPMKVTINGTSQSLVEVLKQKARDGVDVRVLGWVSPLGMGSGFAESTWFDDYAGINSLTCATILELRKEPKIGANAALNALGHASGATHLKMWIMGNSVSSIGFTGGLDMVEDRFAKSTHDDTDNLWHDIVVEVLGSSVQRLYDLFRLMWNLNATRDPYTMKFAKEEIPNVLPGTTTITRTTIAAPDAGSSTVQSLRTIPASNYSSLNCERVPPAVPDAPQGSFQVQLAWQQAISMADTYVYMEDQAFWSRDVMGWINQRLQNAPDLKVILLFSGAKDPADPKLPENQYLTESINHNLLKDLPAEAFGRVRAFRKWGPQTTEAITVQELSLVGSVVRVQTDQKRTYDLDKDALLPATIVDADGKQYTVLSTDQTPKNQVVLMNLQIPTGANSAPVSPTVLVRTFGITVHAKTTLIDDKWAIIGSANCIRRSLFTDWEHSLAFIEGSGGLVSGYRKTLWNEHFQHDNPDDFTDLQSSLHSWEPSWGTAGGAAPPLPVRDGPVLTPVFLESIPLKLAEDPIDSDTQEYYDVFEDTDSRTTWGSICDIMRAVSKPR